MKILSTSLLALSLSSYARPASAHRPETFETAILSLAAGRVSTLSVIPAEGGGDDLTWASWSDYGSNGSGGPTSHLALIRRYHGAARYLWSRRFPGAFEPRIIPLYGDVPAGTMPILLHQQLGADDAVAILYVVGAKAKVSEIGRVEGQTVDLLPWADNAIRVGTSPGDPPLCYRSPVGANKLVKQACP